MECREEITVCGQRAYKVRGIATPFLFRSSGFTQDIYIPEEIVEKEELMHHVVLHENAHKRHGDIWWGYLRNLLLAAYWFHPLVWVAALCSKRDCEYACDSSVIERMNREERISYGNSLLLLVQDGRKENPFHAVSLMSVQKSELGKRIRLIKRGKRKGTVATLLATVFLVIVCICIFTGAETEGNRDAKNQRRGQDSELTMEILLDGDKHEELSRWTADEISQYNNMWEIPEQHMTDTAREFIGELPYQGITYELWMAFHSRQPEQLETATLKNMKTGEEVYIFYDGERHYDVCSLESFVNWESIDG